MKEVSKSNRQIWSQWLNTVFAVPKAKWTDHFVNQTSVWTAMEQTHGQARTRLRAHSHPQLTASLQKCWKSFWGWNTSKHFFVHHHVYLNTVLIQFWNKHNRPRVIKRCLQSICIKDENSKNQPPLDVVIVLPEAGHKICFIVAFLSFTVQTLTRARTHAHMLSPTGPQSLVTDTFPSHLYPSALVKLFLVKQISERELPGFFLELAFNLGFSLSVYDTLI